MRSWSPSPQRLSAPSTLRYEAQEQACELHYLRCCLTRLISAQHNPVDRAVIHLTLAKAAVALFQLYLRTTGSTSSNRDLEREKARLFCCAVCG